MTESTDRPDTRERYTSALNATDLSMVDRRAGAAEMLAAVGISSVLGSLLMRLSAEYDQVAQDVRRTANDATTEIALILMHLKTLREAKDALGLYAIGMATRRRHMLDDRTVLALTGHVLVAWLEENCRKCAGVGRIGGYDGKRQSLCRACGGTGKASASLGQNLAQQVFCADLLRDIQDKAGHGAARDINQNKKAVRLGKERIAADLARTG